MPSISFVSERISFECPNQKLLENWLHNVCAKENQKISELTYIFCSDEYLLDINQKHLQHDFYTDVITFDNSEDDSICGDIFISIERVKENAEEVGVSLFDELHRVIIHGLLHLIGYNDKNEDEKNEMTEKENFYLLTRSF